MSRDRYLSIEAPDSKATVDFLSHGVAVEIDVADGKVRVVVKMSHGEDASTWDEHEAEWPLPERDLAEVNCDNDEAIAYQNLLHHAIEAFVRHELEDGSRRTPEEIGQAFGVDPEIVHDALERMLRVGAVTRTPVGGTHSFIYTISEE